MIKLKTLRTRGVPHVVVETHDPLVSLATIGGIQAPVIVWDFSRGLWGLNEAGESALAAMRLPSDPFTGAPQAPDSVDYVGALRAAQSLPAKGLMVFVDAHLWWVMDAGRVATVAWVRRLRDEFKTTARMLVFLVRDSSTLPAEILGDVIIIDDPLPGREQLAQILDGLIEAVKQSHPDYEIPIEIRERTIDAVTGLTAFAAEQVLALSLTPQGIDLNALWDRKRKVIEQTPGLSVWQGGETLEGIGGLENIKQFLRAIFSGRSRPKAIVWIDEIEKALAGASGPVSDSSGVSQDQLKVLLTYMQDHRVPGMIFVGPPGSGKSLVAKAAGGEVGVPVIALDLGAMKGSLVGESEQRVRTALKVISAVSDDSPLFIATCNSLVALPPELRRRFTLGIFFFDLPTAEERAKIWAIYRRVYEIEDNDPAPVDDGWTGAEIKTCCELSWRLNIPLREAAKYIVPVSKASAEAINQLRQLADGRFISASRPGVYRISDADGRGRVLMMEENL